MKNTILKTISSTAFVFLTLTIFGLAPLTAQDEVKQDSESDQIVESQARNHRRSIVGVWITQVTRRDCATGAPIGAVSNIQNTFAKGGTMLETVVHTPFRSQGNGIWKREHGWNEYSAAFRFMRFDAAGAFVGSVVVRVALTLDATGDNYTSTATNDILDANGNIIASGCATSVGTRFQ